jgi:GrpB-like predicted nucleotidyltransferase (UPF0157 family)
MLGLPKGSVFLASWDEKWESLYISEKEKIIELIGIYVIKCHHIGSTAVKGLSAKPIIDIAIEINSFDDGFFCIDGLETIGYKHRIISELPDRHYFSKGEPRTHQIHMFPKESIYLQKQLAFRDGIRNNETLRKKCQEIKEKLSTEYNTNKLSYADAKTEFINSTLVKLGFKE